MISLEELPEYWEQKNKQKIKQIIKDLETYARVMNNNYLKHKIKQLKKANK